MNTLRIASSKSYEDNEFILVGKTWVHVLRSYFSAASNKFILTVVVYK